MQHVLEIEELREVLMLDGVLRGRVVAEAFAGTDIATWIRGNEVDVVVPDFLRPYLERMLTVRGCRKQENPITFSGNSTVFTQTFAYPGDGPRLRVSYDRTGEHLRMPSYPPTAPSIASADAIVDIQLLAMNRFAMFVQPQDGDLMLHTPVPLHRLMRQCQKRTFSVLRRKASDDELAVVQGLLDDGWTRASREPAVCVHTLRNPVAHLCTICQAPMTAGLLVAQTPCKHTYHAQCWHRFVARRDEAPPPNSDGFFSFQVRKSFVACPVCRHEIDLVQALVPNT